MTMALIFLEQYESFSCWEWKETKKANQLISQRSPPAKTLLAEGTQTPRLVPSREEQQPWATFFTPGLSSHPYFCRVEMLLKTHFLRGKLENNRCWVRDRGAWAPLQLSVWTIIRFCKPGNTGAGAKDGPGRAEPPSMRCCPWDHLQQCHLKNIEDQCWRSGSAAKRVWAQAPAPLLGGSQCPTTLALGDPAPFSRFCRQPQHTSLTCT